MFNLSKARRLGAAAVFAALAFAAPAHAGQYRVSLAFRVILPPDQPHLAGEERSITPGDTVMTARLGWFHTATVANDVRIEIAGVDETITPSSLLLRTIRATGGDLSTLSKQARIFCGELRTNQVANTAGALTLGLTSLATRVARQRRFCVVDTDADSRFDHAFLVGAKRSEDQHMVEIAPTPYSEARNQPSGPEDRIEIRYSGGSLLGRANFPVNFIIGGNRQVIAEMLTGDERGIVRTRANPNFRSDRIPVTLDIGSARLTVLAFDSQTKTARIRYDHDFRMTPVAVTFPAQTIYVYIPSSR